jgi:epoxyqueuosine reductase QueG
VDSRDKQQKGLPEEIIAKMDVDEMGTISLDKMDEPLLKKKIKTVLPSAKSIIVLLQEVFPETVRHITSKASLGDIALRDLFDSNCDIASGHLNWEAYDLVRQLHKIGYKGLVLPAKGGPYGGKYLEGAVSYKKLAEIAGLGIAGWNSLLLTLKYGPKVRLACVITDALFETSTATEDYLSPCEKCGGACIKICPIKAINKPAAGVNYQIDKYACNTYLAASGACSECMKVCPGFKVASKQK